LKKKTIGLIDGRSGNIGSIKKAIKDIIKNKPFRLKVIEGDFNVDDFEKIILPGQGAYATLMKNLKQLSIMW
jgi:imidazoleglycerol phosphate synthase glutamine amidotransferase subunit HisH